MSRRSAGILLFRRGDHGPEFFLVHPGGPFWAKRDEGAWSIPKGEFGEDELPLAAARREFEEETGVQVSGPFHALSPRKQTSGKIIHAWACEGDLDATAIRSNLFEMEWPPKSGRWQQFPEADRAAWFPMEEARQKIVKGQIGFLEEFENRWPG